MRKIYYLLPMFLMAAFLVNGAHLSNNLYFSAKLSGGSEVPPVSTTASGVAVLSLNGTYDSLCINIATTHLSGAITGLHIHEGAAGTNGSVVVNFTPEVIDNRVSTRIPISALNMEKLLKGMYYVNVHTSQNANGEIRGQLNLERDWSHWAWLDEGYVSSGASGYGLGQFTLSHDRRWLSVKVLTHGLTGNITAAHLHSVTTSGVVIGLDSLIVNGSEIVGVVDYSAFSADTLVGGFYLNVHTAANPLGEIAGVTNINKGRLSFDCRMDEVFHTSGSPGKAFAQMTLSATLDTLWYDIVWDTLAGNFSAMHIHGESGGVMHNMTPNVSGNECHGMWAGVPDSAVEMFLDGGAYINLHSDQFPNGEIAGNILRFAREGYHINIDAAQTDPNVISPATGGGLVSINRERNSAHYMMAADNFIGTVNAAHFHLGAFGTSGGVEYTLPWMNGGAYGYWSDSSTIVFTTAKSALFQNNEIYVNIHTDQFASGEARGQVERGTSCYINSPLAADEALESLSGVQVFPNPTAGMTSISIESGNRVKARLEMTDLSGRVLLSRDIDLRAGSNQLEMDLGSLSSGMYLLRIVDTQNRHLVTKRVAKNL